ncbi:MAG: hypothetical protein DM484_03085 [Candidatus Methylumidiphilus alinenensis]|uniref:DDE Tnp4 domain-containing protein n=1 Tax=Candidatus Methylumidiphilus alinenensis TaxID=2202197 RepID=A0A2W4RY73_9GAMM|nr:MAG: hypothetical protein DM484_03085 [Candidatus Methylumidiphilus alinenensis]
MCWASFSASVRGMPTTMWRISCRSYCGACRTLAYCLSGRLGLPRSFFNSLRNMATSSSTGWSAPASDRRTRNFKKPASAEKKRHTLQALVLTTLHRKILFLFCVFAGSIHDYKLMKKVFDPTLKWFHQVNLWLDLGFLGAEKDYGSKSKINLPHKRPKKSKNNPKPKLTAAQVKHNRQHAAIPSPKVMPLLHEFCRFLRFGKCGRQLKTPHRFCQANLISAACIFAP